MTSRKKEDFSRRFIDLLERERVPAKARQYYVRHLERWGSAFRQRPAEVDKKDFLEGHLRKLSHTAGVESFLVYQTADAVRLAHEVLLGEEWARRVDWVGNIMGISVRQFHVHDVCDSVDYGAFVRSGFGNVEVE